MGDIYDFENADIGKLAIHLERAWRPREIITLPFAALAAGKQLFSGRGLIAAFNVIEPTGAAPATINFLDGNDANGTLLVPYALTAGQSARDQFGPWGITIERGIFANVTAGSVTGTLMMVRQ